MPGNVGISSTEPKCQRLRNYHCKGTKSKLSICCNSISTALNDWRFWCKNLSLNVQQCKVILPRKLMHWGIFWGKSRVPNQNRVLILLDHRIILVRDDFRRTSSSTPCSEQHHWDHCSGLVQSNYYYLQGWRYYKKLKVVRSVWPPSWFSHLTRISCVLSCVRSLSFFHCAPLRRVCLSSPHLPIRLL